MGSDQQEEGGVADLVPTNEGAVASARSAKTARMAGFADALDRGDLLNYPFAPVVRNTGAYTWYSAGFSEEHAIRAIVTGRMRVTQPDGAPITLDYVRHVEHADGNWSWIGLNPNAPSQIAVITFGPEAVFGSIPRRDGVPPLRLMLANAEGWVISANPYELGNADSAATYSAGRDYLVPPKLSTTAGAETSVLSEAATKTPVVQSMAGARFRSTTSQASTLVDVLVGYTNGFASERGGNSAAVTRVHNLVDMANQVYANSQIDVRLRLVHSMQVTYPDVTPNGTALEELTGFKASSIPITTAPALSELRAARDRYGADLVVLIRQFNAPENGACGIAWLIGGGRSDIEQRDAPFGYSVVSDGQNRGSDGQAYFCGEDAFVRAIGHNLGYRPDAVADVGGRARAIPTVATFRAAATTAVPKGDVDASGTTDLTWFKPGSLDAWLMNGPVIQGHVTYEGLATNDIPTVDGQFNDTPNRDLAWRQYYDWGTVLQFWWDGPSYLRASPQYTMSTGWRLQASGDRDGDGISDLYWRSAVDGRLVYWEMSSTWPIRRSYAAFAQSPDADLLMVGDFNGDGLSDLFFRTRATGANEIWFPDGDGYTVAPRGRMSKYWRPAGAADYDGDGDDDVVWRSAIDHRVLVWIMQDGLRQDVAVFDSDSDRQLLTVAYLDADRRLDLVWRRADGTVSAWLNTGGGFEHRYIGNRDTSWSLFVGGR